MNEFDKYLTRWNLTPDGAQIITQTSKLLPVRYKRMPAMLKIAMVSEERAGGELMLWWNGQGAAPILAHNDNALLMERATGERSLAKMARRRQDDEASRIICSVVDKLHTVKDKPLPATLIPLPYWFKALEPAAIQYGGVLNQASTIAKELLTRPQEQVILHGDIHHENILDFGVHGWLAIDPKGLLGERGCDFANIFCNPDTHIATMPGRLEQQATIIANTAGLDRSRLIKWILAYAGLSAAWHLEDGSNPELALAVAKIASSTLNL